MAATYSANGSEKTLVARCLARDRKAWDEFLERHYGTIVKVASWQKWRFHPQDVEDVRQDIMEEVVKALKSFQFKSRINTFVFKIAANTCIEHLRRDKVLQRTGSVHIALDPIESGTGEEVGEICPDPSVSSEELLLEQEMLYYLKKALFRLEERCKELIQQRYFLDIPFHEIAQRTGVKTNTLIIQLKRCLVRLLSILREET